MSRLRARFRIPSYDEISLKEEAEPDNRWNKSDGQSVPSIGPASPQELQQMQTVQNRSQAAWEDEVMPIISSSAPANKTLSQTKLLMPLRPMMYNQSLNFL